MLKQLIALMVVGLMLGSAVVVGAGVVIGGARTSGGGEPEPVIDGFIGNTVRNDGAVISSTSIGVFDEFVTTTAGTIRYVHVYIENGSNDFNVAIYNSDGTELLVDGTPQNVAGTGWFHFELDNDIVIDESTTYILSFGTSSDTYWACGLVSGGGTYFKDTSHTTGTTMPSSISKDQTVTNWNLSIYADNSPTGV